MLTSKKERKKGRPLCQEGRHVTIDADILQPNFWYEAVYVVTYSTGTKSIELDDFYPSEPIRLFHEICPFPFIIWCTHGP